jgi:hypothetical protein
MWMSDPAKPPSRIKNAAAERLAIPAPTKYAFAILPCSFDEDKLESASPLHYETEERIDALERSNKLHPAQRRAIRQQAPSRDPGAGFQ